jgi:8-amino-7-oxononanoate synthase
MSWLGLKDARVLTAASLAKAFGAPVAFAGGTRKAMVRLEQRSETRVHCSPVAAPALHAAEAAVAFNEHSGERTRGALMRLLMRLKEKLAETAFAARGALFPSVALGECEGFPAEEVHAALSRMEIRTVLQRERVSGRPQVGVLVTAGHTVREIDRLASSLAGLADVRRQPKTGGVRARF